MCLAAGDCLQGWAAKLLLARWISLLCTEFLHLTVYILPSCLLKPASEGIIVYPCAFYAQVNHFLQVIKRTPYLLNALCGHMRINLSRPAALVTEQLLNIPQVSP